VTSNLRTESSISSLDSAARLDPLASELLERLDVRLELIFVADE
jgi:hypothetical protein